MYIYMYYICIIVLYVHYTFSMILLCSEDEREETLPASRVISSQILGYDGREVDSKERVEVTFPVHVRKLMFHACNYVTDK